MFVKFVESFDFVDSFWHFIHLLMNFISSFRISTPCSSRTHWNQICCHWTFLSIFAVSFLNIFNKYFSSICNDSHSFQCSIQYWNRSKQSVHIFNSRPHTNTYFYWTYNITCTKEHFEIWYFGISPIRVSVFGLENLQGHFQWYRTKIEKPWEIWNKYFKWTSFGLNWQFMSSKKLEVVLHQKHLTFHHMVCKELGIFHSYCFLIWKITLRNSTQWVVYSLAPFSLQRNCCFCLTKTTALGLLCWLIIRNQPANNFNTDKNIS